MYGFIKRFAKNVEEKLDRVVQEPSGKPIDVSASAPNTPISSGRASSSGVEKESSSTGGGSGGGWMGVGTLFSPSTPTSHEQTRSGSAATEKKTPSSAGRGFRSFLQTTFHSEPRPSKKPRGSGRRIRCEEDEHEKEKEKEKEKSAKRKETETPETKVRMDGKLEQKPADIEDMKDEEMDATSVAEAHVAEARVDEARVAEAHVDAARVDAAHVDEAHVDEARVDDARVDDARVDKAHVDEAHVDEAHVDEARVHKAHVDEVRVDEVRVDEAHVDDAHVDDARVDEARVDKAHVDEARVDAARVDEARVDEVRVAEARVDEVRVAEAHVDEARVDEARVDEVRVAEAHVDEARVDKAHVDEVRVDEVRVDKAHVGDVSVGIVSDVMGKLSSAKENVEEVEEKKDDTKREDVKVEDVSAETTEIMMDTPDEARKPEEKEEEPIFPIEEYAHAKERECASEPSIGRESNEQVEMLSDVKEDEETKVECVGDIVEHTGSHKEEEEEEEVKEPYTDEESIQLIQALKEENMFLRESVRMHEDEILTLRNARKEALEFAERLQREANDKLNELSFQLELKEKEAMELLEEGKSYSAESSVLRGKLRASLEKNKDQTKEIATLKSELESKMSAISSLQTKFDAMEADMKKQRESYAKLRQVSQVTSDQLQSRNTELNTLKRKIEQLSAQLADQSKVKEEEVALLLLKHERELEEVKKSHSAKVEEFTRVIEDLQSTLEGLSQEKELHGVALDQEVVELRIQVRELEKQNEELSSSSARATQPLLKELSALHRTIEMKQESFDAVEASLKQRLEVADRRAVENEQKYLLADGRVQDMSRDIARLESRLDVMQTQNEEISLQREAARKSLEESALEMARLKKDCANKVSVLEEKTQSLQKDLQQMESEKNALDIRSKESERRLRSEIDGLRKEYDNLMRKVRESGDGSLSKSTTSRSSSGSLIGRDSRTKDVKEGSKREELRGEDILRSLHLTEYAASSVDENPRSGKGEDVGSVLFPPDTPTSSGGNHLVSGEIAMYQEQIAHLEQQRYVLSERLAAATSEVGRLKDIRKEFDGFKKQAQGMAARYKVTLELLGEKEETIMALEADLEEVKEVFRKQVVDLLAEIDSLKSKIARA